MPPGKRCWQWCWEEISGRLGEYKNWLSFISSPSLSLSTLCFSISPRLAWLFLFKILIVSSGRIQVNTLSFPQLLSRQFLWPTQQYFSYVVGWGREIHMYVHMWDAFGSEKVTKWLNDSLPAHQLLCVLFWHKGSDCHYCTYTTSHLCHCINFSQLTDWRWASCRMGNTIGHAQLYVWATASSFSESETHRDVAPPVTRNYNIL